MPATSTTPHLGYRPRSARTPLKELIEAHLDDLERHWDERFAAHHGPLHPRVRDLCERHCRCGDPHFGFLRLRCEDGHEKLLPFSCKARGYAERMNMLSVRASPRMRLRVLKALPT